MRKICLLLLLLSGLLLALSWTAQAVEFVIQYDDGIDYSRAGWTFANDTAGVWFEPPTQSQVLAGQFKFSAGYGGSAQVALWYMASTFNEANYFKRSEAGSPGTSPLGVPLIPPGIIDIDFTAGDWEEVVFEDYGYFPEDLDVGLNNFYLGYIVGDNVPPGNPSIVLDAGDDRPYHSLCYLSSPGGIHPNEPGWWAYGFDMFVRARVNMYGDPPPVIEGLTDPSDTYNSGPYEVSATITDTDTTGAPGSGEVTEARLIYSLNGGDENTVMMTHVGDLYEGNIPDVAVDTKINFRVEADDNAGHTTLAPSIAGYNFTKRAPSGSTILLVNDSGSNDGDAFYRGILDEYGIGYDYWYINAASPNDMGYPGMEVVNTDYYNALIWFTGSGYPGNLPDNDANLALDPVANFMDDGGNFFLSSSDYLGGAFNPDVWEAFTAIHGTFMYEYLMVESGYSDAHLDPVTGESRDTMYIGVAGDPVSGQFASTWFEDHPSPNYNDFVYPREGADTCFFTQIDMEPAGVRYEGNFKMVFLPWILEAADPTEAEGIYLNALEYLGAGPQITLLQGSRYGIYGNTPHRAIVDVTDPNGVANVYCRERWDDGPWLFHTMSLWEGHYRWIFTPPGSWETQQYRILATDNQGNVSVGPIYDVWHTGLNYTPGNNFLYCSDQPYEGNYGNFDSTVTAKLTAMGIDYDLWDVDEYGTPDFWTVLNQYTQCFWVGYADYTEPVPFPYSTADNPFSLYLGSGNSLLFSSDEEMGMWTGFADTDFAPGDFAYDWLKLASTVNDKNYPQLLTLADSLTLQMSDIIALNDLGNGYWADFLVPLGGNSVNVLNGFIDPDLGVAGSRDNIAQSNMVTLGFCLFEMEAADRFQFIQNVIGYWNTHGGSAVGVQPEPEPIPLSYRLDQNYPNPFNPVTEIRFSLPERTHVELTIYNLLGQEVAKLLDRDMNPGTHIATWNASYLTSGVYFYKMKTAKFEQARKMILVK